MYLLIPLFPLMGCLLAGLFGRFLGFKGARLITTAGLIISTIFSLIVFFEVAFCGSDCTLSLSHWFYSEMVDASWGFYFDTLTVVMLLVVTSVSSLVHLYSISYMSHDPHIPRFMCYLSLFTFFMLMLVTADNFTMAIFLAILFLGVYGIIIAGWFSNYKDGFLRSLRSAAQMVSYEVSIGLILITVLLCVGSLNLTEIVLAQQKIWYCIPLFPLLILFFISCLAETNRAPFDLPEAEAELVAGYNVEYSSMGFALFFLGEYANILVMSSLCSLFFLGGWLPMVNLLFFHWIPGVFWLTVKINFFLFLFVWVRAAFPRYRYDQLMTLGWKVFLPLSLAWVVLVSGTLISFDWLP